MADTKEKVVMKKKKVVLVTGGAGYIGSHVALYLIKKEYQVVIIDNYSQGQDLLPFFAEVIKGDYGDAVLLDQLFTEYSFDAVIHCGALSVAEISAANPLSYYENNDSQSITLLQQMKKHNILHFVF